MKKIVIKIKNMFLIWFIYSLKIYIYKINNIRQGKKARILLPG